MRRPARLTALGAFAASCWAMPSAMCAQTSTQAESGASVGVAHLRQAALPEANALTLGADGDVAWERAALRANALVATAGIDRTTAQALISASTTARARAGLWVDLTAFGSLFSATNATPTASSEAMARLRLGQSSGAALGAGGGSFSQNHGTAPILHVQGDAWRTVGHERFLGEASVVRTSVRRSTPNVPPTKAPLAYTDLSALWRHGTDRLSVDVLAGARATSAHAFNGWGSLSTTTALGARTALVLSVGRTLDDPVRGVPHTNFFTAAVRLSSLRTSVARAAPAGPHLTVTPLGAGRVRFEVHALQTSPVELMGDFTDWSPVALEHGGNVWRLERTLPAGLHRVLIRIDGGEWTAPANLPHTTDDLGGVVGLITVR